MEKALVEVFVPVLGKTYDMYIPFVMPMYEVLELIGKAIRELSDGQFVYNRATTICNRKDGTIYNINLSVYELGLQTGSKLMLI